MSKDLSRITAVKKSLDWAREAFFFFFFSTSSVLEDGGEKFSLGRRLFFLPRRPAGIRGQRVSYRKDDSAQPGGSRAQGQVAPLKVLSFFQLPGVAFSLHVGTSSQSHIFYH